MPVSVRGKRERGSGGGGGGERVSYKCICPMSEIHDHLAKVELYDLQPERERDRDRDRDRDRQTGRRATDLAGKH